MALSVGIRLGPYEILGAIGAGGMGEVYRARDTKLNREVALKILPDAFAADPDRLARFQREAQVLASLNHPNIAHIHGLEESRGVRALVMELVEGEDLSQRLARGAIPLDEALPIANQIAEALEAAHEQGIIHRDLKPANIKVRPDGTVKVLDFGLAKALDRAGTLPGVDAVDSPTFTSPAVTGLGVILGTAAYMSPEQARGRATDARADIWAFGVVLYEMLTGKPLFSRGTASDVLASILRDGPSWETLPSDTPASVRRLLRRCLEKDPQLRLRHAGDARLELMDAQATTGPSAGVLHRGLSWPRAALLALAVAIVTAVAFLVVFRLSGTTELPVRKWIIAQEYGEDVWGRENIPAISRDGRRVAYTDGMRLRIRELASLETREVPGTGMAALPTWSPDGTHIAYSIDHKSLWKAPANGGTPVKLCDLPAGLVFGIAWRPDRTIVVNVSSSPATAELLVVPEGGGRPQRLVAEHAQGNPLAGLFVRGMPDGSIIYRRRRDGEDETVVEQPGKPPKVVALPLHSGATYARSGHLLYAGRETPDYWAVPFGLWAVPFDLSKGVLTGEPFRIAESGLGPTVSDDGTLAYGRTMPGVRQLTWFHRDGSMRGTAGQPQDSMHAPAISPDGKRVAVVGLEKGSTNIWVHEVARSAKSRLTFSPGDAGPAWHPTDGRMAFETANWDIFTVSTNGGVEPKLLVGGDNPQFQAFWSRDGRHFVYAQVSKGHGDIWTIESGGQPKPVLDSPFNEMAPTLSPDGRFIAYLSDETGAQEIFVCAFPSGEGKRQVSSHGGMWPKWSPRGDEIFFVEGSTLMAAGVRTQPRLQLDAPKALFKLEDRAATFPIYDTPDGQRFIIVRTLKAPQNGIAIVQNWLAEFRK